MSTETNTQPETFWDWQSAVVVLFLVQVAATRLDVTNWTPFLAIGQALGFWGVLLGFALGYTILPPRNVRRFGLAYGLMLIPWQLLSTVERTDTLYYDLDLILFRLYYSISQFFQSQPIYDPLFFTTLVAIGFWTLGLSAGYQLTKHRNFLRIIAPSGVVILGVQVYDAYAASRVWFLAIYILLALILLGRLYFLQSKKRWQAERVFFTSDAEGEISRLAFLIAAIAILIAWSFPAVLSRVGPAAKAWSEWTRPIGERLSDAVSALDSSYGLPSEKDFYGEQLQLGSDTPTDKTPVFYVKVNRGASVPRYYWRGRVYDQYLNGQWTSSLKTVEQTFNPQIEPPWLNSLAPRVEAEFTVTLNFPRQELMYAPAELIWVDRPSRLVTLPADELSGFDVSAWLSASKLSAGDQYKARARIAKPNVEDLREAGEEYPLWVRERYLQVPPEMAAPLKDLALRLTESQLTPYDKAEAITRFLREDIEYADKLATSPPKGQDPLLWVLFEYKRGFCMYSASAEVLLLRSLGIPARMAVGFAQGEYDSTLRRYVVARVNAHAWPEVYFPNIGWVEFEPTGNQDILARPNRPIERDIEEESKADLRDPRDILPEIDPEEPNRPVADSPEKKGLTLLQVLNKLYPFLLAAIFLLGIFMMRRYAIVDRLPVYLEGRYNKSGRQPPRWLARWAKWVALLPIQRVFHSVDVSLSWFGRSQPAHVTSQKRAQILTGMMPSAREEIAALQEELETALFRAQEPDLRRARRASRKILLEAALSRLRKKLI